jgi:integrating conjugative element protein (TIGR03749 family)
LRVQSAGGAIYLRASAPIPPTRLQLQDVESGALILLDIAAEPAKAGQPALEPVRIVEGDVPATRYGEPAKPADDDAERTVPAAKRATPVAVVLTRYAAQNLYAPLRTVEPFPASAASTCAVGWSWTPCCPRCRCVRRRWPRGGSKTSG